MLILTWLFFYYFLQLWFLNKISFFIWILFASDLCLFPWTIRRFHCGLWGALLFSFTVKQRNPSILHKTNLIPEDSRTRKVHVISPSLKGQPLVNILGCVNESKVSQSVQKIVLADRHDRAAINPEEQLWPQSSVKVKVFFFKVHCSSGSLAWGRRLRRRWFVLKRDFLLMRTFLERSSL